MKPLTIALLLFFISCGNSENKENNSPASTDPKLEELNSKIANDPQNVTLYVERANYFGSKENFQLAFDDLARAKQIDSTHSPIYASQGKFHFAQKRVQEAYRDYQTCLRHDPKNQDCLLEKAALDITLENFDLAFTQINEALRQNERIAYAYYLKGRIYKQYNDTSFALSSYQTAIEIDPSYYDAYIEAGLVCAYAKNDLAIQYYNSAIDLHPNFIEPLYNKAMYLQETGIAFPARYDEAIACYDKIIAIDANASVAYYNKGFIQLVYKKNYNAALPEFSKAIEKNPVYAEAYYNRGLCYENLKKNKEALADYNKALEINPTFDLAAKGKSKVLGEH
ncbi:MAG: tetratricopeptide repeat protein [Bacteroidota bacterium]